MMRRGSGTGAGGGTGSGSGAGASSATTSKMGVGEFFSLLRGHVPPKRLESLLSALASFNAKQLNASQLMTKAKDSLAGIKDEELRASGLKKAPIDLLGAFESYMVRK